MTTSLSKKPRGLILTSVLWMTGFFFVAPYGTHAEEQSPAKAATFGYVANLKDDTVSVIDTVSNTVVTTIRVGAGPISVAITSDGTQAYVANEEDSTVSVIDTASNTVIATIPGFFGPDGVAITPNRNDPRHQSFVYVTNLFSDLSGNKVSVIDTTSNTVVATILVGNGPVGIAITPDGLHAPEHDDRRRPLAYVANVGDDTVSVIDIFTNAVVATIPGVGSAPNGVAITPDGTRTYVTNKFGKTVSVIDTTSNTVVATILVGNGPVGIAITPDGTHAYVTNSFDNTISVIDTEGNTVVATIPVGNFPVDVDIISDRTHSSGYDDHSHQPLAYVTNAFGNTVSVIDTASNKVVATIPVGAGPQAVAFATVTPSHHSSE